MARAKSALKMDPSAAANKEKSSTGPIHLNTSSTKKSSSSIAGVAGGSNSSSGSPAMQSSVNTRVASKSSTAVSNRNGPPSSTTAPISAANPKKPSSEASKKAAGRLLHQHQPHESQSSPITTTSAAGAARPSRRITASRDRVSIQSASHSSLASHNKKASTSVTSTANTAKKKPSSSVPTPAQSASKKSTETNEKPVVISKDSLANKRPSQRVVPTSKPLASTASVALKEEAKIRDDSPSSTHVNVSSDSSVSPPPPASVPTEASRAEAAIQKNNAAIRCNTRDMVSPISSPNMSDISDTEMESESIMRRENTSSKVKRSESDGIVMTERPMKEKPPVRRCESTDDATKDRLLPSIDEIPPPMTSRDEMSFPQNIKTVASATIVKGPEDTTHKIGETLHFLSHYFGNPEPRVIWIKNGQKLIQDGRISIKTYSGESTLIVRDLRGDDSGKYEIQIENEVGNDAATASLSVEGPPEPPAGRPYVSHIDSETSSLTLAWYGSTFDGGSMVTGYVVEMSCWPITCSRGPPDASDWQILNCETRMSTSFVVTGLDKDKEYIFRVKAVNACGHSPPSKVSEPVSLTSNQASGSSGNEDNADYDETGTEAEDTSKVEEEECNESHFEAPFEHRIAQVEDGSIFKSKYEIYEELGRGRFGVVFKVKDKVSGEELAAKFVRCRKSEEKQKCKDEIAIMNMLESPKLLQLAAAYENPREIIMVMEYIGGGELFEKVVADDFTLTERDCVLFMRQICEAVGYMHEKNIVHLDLKPENILCKSKKSHLIKIIDFGLTKKLKVGEDVRILFGTPEFVSPEVISYEPVSTTSDMWSVGVICYVLLSGLSPFMGDSDVETFANISGIAYDFDDEAFDAISEEAKDFISKLLVKFQNKRLTASQCLLHPWLTLSGGGKNHKEINTDKLKSFLMRRRWQKAAHAIRALGRFTSLGFRNDAKDGASTITALSTQSADF